MCVCIYMYSANIKSLYVYIYSKVSLSRSRTSLSVNMYFFGPQIPTHKSYNSQFLRIHLSIVVLGYKYVFIHTWYFCLAGTHLSVAEFFFWVSCRHTHPKNRRFCDICCKHTSSTESSEFFQSITSPGPSSKVQFNKNLKRNF